MFFVEVKSQSENHDDDYSAGEHLQNKAGREVDLYKWSFLQSR